MTNAQRRAYKAANRRRRAAAQLLASLPNPNSRRAQREALTARALQVGGAMHAIEREIVRAGGVVEGMEPSAVEEIANMPPLPEMHLVKIPEEDIKSGRHAMACCDWPGMECRSPVRYKLECEAADDTFYYWAIRHKWLKPENSNNRQ